MSLGQDGLETPTQLFQSLSLSIPNSSTQFDYIEAFLVLLLNLPDESAMIAIEKFNDEDVTIKLNPNRNEILPDILLPNDIWLRDNINVKDVKIKVTMLNEINSMITREISQLQQPLDETSLLYYQKLLLAYKFYDAPVRRSFGLSNDFSLKEDIAEESGEFTIDESKLLNRTNSNQSSTTSLKTHHSYFSHSANSLGNNVSTTNNSLHNNGNGLPYSNSNNPKRSSNQSREPVLSRKRFLSLVNHGNSNNSNNNIQNTSITTPNMSTNGFGTTSPTSIAFSNDFASPTSNTLGHSTPHNITSLEETISGPNEDDQTKKQQTLNSLLNKSKIYNKIKKNRELSASMNSNVSTPSLPSNRNSVNTIATGVSQNSKSKRSSNLTSPEANSAIDLKHSSMVPVPAFASLSISQRQEIQRNKFEYYTQLKQLLIIVKKILSNFQNDSNDVKCYKLMDFIKRYLFKFVVLDVSDMVVSYGETEAYQMYSRLN